MKTTGDVIAEIRQSKGMGVFEKETAAIAALEQSAPKLKRSKELLKGLYYSDEMKHLIEAAKKEEEADKRIALLEAKESLLKQKVCSDQMEAIVFVNEIAKGFSWNVGLPYPETMKRKTKRNMNLEDFPLSRIVKMAENGNAEAQFYLGKCYFNGYRDRDGYTRVEAFFLKWMRILKNGYAGIVSETTISQHFNEAEKWLLKAGKNGVVEACGFLGDVYRMSDFGCENSDAAVYWYKKGMEYEDARSICGYAICRLMGIGINQDENEARKLFQKLVEEGYAPAKLYMAILYQQGMGGFEVNGEKTIEWCKRAIKEKVVEAYLVWGECYTKGVGGIKQDYKKAAKIYRKGTLNGDNGSAYNFAVTYYMGEGVRRNTGKALRLFKLAASWGDSGAMEMVGQMYYYGNCVTKDYQTAMEYLIKAANRGNIEAMKILATAYKDGVGVKKNVEEAMKWVNKVKQYE